jgi:hypothetical protein
VLNGTVHMTEPYYIYESLYMDLPKKWSHEFSCASIANNTIISIHSRSKGSTAVL